MQVTIDFQRHIDLHRDFGQAILDLVKKSGGELGFKGNHGLWVAHLSWDEAYKLGAKVSHVCGKYGIESISSLRLTIEDDFVNPKLSDVKESLMRLKTKRSNTSNN